MPIDHSPVKTRSRENSKGRDKPQVQRTLSDSSAITPSDDIPAAVQAAVEAVINNDGFINKIVELVAAKVSETVSENLLTTIKGALAEVDRLKGELVSLGEKLTVQKDEYSKRVDELEQYQRRNNVRVFGVEEKQGEDTDKLVVGIIQKQLKLSISVTDIDRSHRVGAPVAGPDGKERPRPIIVRFVSYRKRSEVFSNKKRLKGSGVVMREDLTSHRLELLRRAMGLYGPKNVWTLDGRILWITEDKKRGRATWSL